MKRLLLPLLVILLVLAIAGPAMAKPAVDYDYLAKFHFKGDCALVDGAIGFGAGKDGSAFMCKSSIESKFLAYGSSVEYQDSSGNRSLEVSGICDIGCAAVKYELMMKQSGSNPAKYKFYLDYKWSK